MSAVRAYSVYAPVMNFGRDYDFQPSTDEISREILGAGGRGQLLCVCWIRLADFRYHVTARYIRYALN